MASTNKSSYAGSDYGTASSEGFVATERNPKKRKTMPSNKGVSTDKQPRARAEENTMTSTDVGIPSKSQSQPIAILGRALTEEEENIVKTILFLPKKQRHAHMPNAFDSKTGDTKAPFKWRLQRLIPELRKSCIPCQKALLICRKTNQTDSCSNCLEEEDCVFNKSQGVANSSQSQKRKRDISETPSKELEDSVRSSKNNEVLAVSNRSSKLLIRVKALQHGEPEKPTALEGGLIPHARNQVALQLAANPPQGAVTYLEEDELSMNLAQPSRSDKMPAVPLAYDHEGITQALAKSMPTLYGRDVLADDVLEETFTRIASVAKQYTLRMRNEAKRIGFLQEKLRTLELKNPQQLLLQALRDIFVVPTGVDINDKILQSQLQSMDYDYLIQAVLAIQVRNMVFKAPSPFEDETAWREEILSSTSPTVTDMIFQSRRIKQSKTKEFQERVAQKVDRDVMNINQAMFPIVAGDNGGETNTQGSHVEIATLANQVRTKIGAYTGSWSEIWSRFGAKFNPIFHRLEDNSPWEGDQDLLDRRVLVTLCPGIRREVLNGKWFPCVKAIVVLQEDPLLGSGKPMVVLPGFPRKVVDTR